MLSRVADSLFWMSRYVERAENTARMLDVNLDLFLDLGPLEETDIQSRWMDVLMAMGEDERYISQHAKVDAFHVLEALTFVSTNPHSISSCIRLARENARTVRDQISSEMWEQLNRTYLSLSDLSMERVWQDGPHRFYQGIKEASQTFQGVTDATMTHGEGWEFIRIGKFLERADQTTRLLDLRHKLLQPGSERISNGTDMIEWMAVLKSCSGLEAYRKSYNTTVDPFRVAEFLILHESFPRSVRFSMNEVAHGLMNISPSSHGQFANAAQKMSARVRADLDFTECNEIFNAGLHEQLDLLQIKFNLLGNEIAKCYLTVQSGPESELIQQQQQQQQQREPISF